MKRKKRYYVLGGLLSLLVLSCSGNSKSELSPDPTLPIEPTTGAVIAYTTTANRLQEFVKSTFDFAEGVNMSPNTIRLDGGAHFQTMDGFGAAITGSTAYNLLKMRAADRSRFLRETFSVDQGMGYSYIRIAIGCSDFSLGEYTLNDKPGIENFALQEEEMNYVIPVLKEILAINPKIKILGSPWTAPKWMKVKDLESLEPYDSWTGGHLNPKYYQDYAKYFVKWIEALHREKIEVYGVTPQNEPLNAGNSASMLMFWAEQRDFVRDALGPKLKAAGFDTKIYAFDHNYNYDNIAEQQSYPLKIFEDQQATSFFAGSAYHNYGGDKRELNNIHLKAPEKEIIFTETSIGTWNNGQDLANRLVDDMKEVGLGTVNNWSKAVIVWNLMLDSERGPYREGGCKTCYGAVDVHSSDYSTITKNSHYFIIGHLSAVVQPGAVRIGTEGKIMDGIVLSAFQNPDNTYAVVLANDNVNSVKLTLADSKNHFTVDIPSKSVVSYRWKK